MQTLHTPIQAAHWLQSRVTGTLCADSRKLRAGDGFVAWPGAAVDGRKFVPDALGRGAAACLVEHEHVESFGLVGDAVACYPGLKAATGVIASEYFSHPSQALDVLAVTGTNGKTSTTWWLAQALSNLQQPHRVACALAGTFGIGVAPLAGAAGDPLAQLQPTGLTTPDPITWQRALRQFADQGLVACALEASSIGLQEHRLDGTRIRVALFTNFTQDHLDYHGSMQAYWEAKHALFAWPGLQAAVINVDDAHGAQLAQRLEGSGLDLWTVSMQSAARLRALDVQHTAQGLGLWLVLGERQQHLRAPVIGHYNVSNLLGVVAALCALGVDFGAAVRACESLDPVPGRMDCLLQPGKPLLVIDYAHTPDALDQALAALKILTQQRGGELWCVFGCGGNRDTGKRPLMAAVAQKHAQHVVVTSDNPRAEKPEAIISQILLGLSRSEAAQVQADRALAIAQTVAQARAQDVVLIAGKGHETTQEMHGQKLPFSDKAHAQAALQLWGVAA